MKCCPNCGYTDTLENRQLQALFEKHFPGIPVFEMLERQWISINDWTQEGEKIRWHQHEKKALIRKVKKELAAFEAGVNFLELESKAALEKRY